MPFKIMKLPIKLQIPESFYKEETLCGHLVTCKEKKIWAVELDLLNEFKQVCEKYNLKWYMAYGSLLGTIRHKGFIPWDNDVDVFMSRGDFHKLCDIASEAFKEPYFLSTPLSENGRFYRPFAKLCNSLTTGGSEDLWLQGVNCGLFIDIFILDDMPDNDKEIKRRTMKANHYAHLARFLSPYPRYDKGLKAVKNWFWNLLWKFKYNRCKGDFIYAKVDQIYGDSHASDKYIGLYEGACQSFLKFEKSLFSNTKMMPFELLQVPVPSGYATILRQLYGDYMQFPSKDQRATHPYLDMEPEIPYPEFYKKKFS